ncbi:sulfite oxidase [Bacillus sp. BRMEA1]|uniref:sulfite oxidase n=1 Tax=Neobacillus endophyticus TaxID=2738405 RepID=UPI0015657640|nr:sulfite oxidase [Neobacillus endophyticus]NRD79656.1 sulfite oxidase [Neobacillus endophyticus]
MYKTSYPYGKPSLVVRNLMPENKETPIEFLEDHVVDNKLFYRRNHFLYPQLTNEGFWLPINGFIHSPALFSMKDLLRLPSKTIKVVMECAGNKRHFFEPKVFGEQWEKGAISQGYWKGVPLKSLLELVGVKNGAKEVVFEGYDYGEKTNLDQVVPFSRSLPLEKAMHPDTIIAYEYNQQPIGFQHGYPLRLIVPQWYAMASVKWLKQITVVDNEFNGPFQTDDYVYYPKNDNNSDSYPVTFMNVNSTIQKPLHMQILQTGKHIIKGIAWTGKGIISKVEISINNGESWHKAIIVNQAMEPYGWVAWRWEWSALDRGEYTILSRAADSLNRIQPLLPFWNRKGYGYNAVDKIKVKIE